jgi:acyl carrier protein
MSDRPKPSHAEIVDRTRTWVQDNFLYMRPDWPLEEGSPLLRSGVIDSIGVIELVGFLEVTFGVTIPEHLITEENLGTLGAIGRFVSGGATGPVAGDRTTTGGGAERRYGAR